MKILALVVILLQVIKLIVLSYVGCIDSAKYIAKYVLHISIVT